MSNYSWRGARVFSPFRFQALLLFNVLLICSFVVHGQGVGSTRGLPSSSGGSNTIQGKVFFPDGPASAKRLKVRLSGTSYMGGSTQTDEDGNFRFNSLEAGPYTITVEGGDEYDTVVENVNIDRESISNGRIIQLPIYLRPKGATAAMFAGVPKDAVDAYKKGMSDVQSGNSKKAVENLGKAVATHPNFGLAQAELGTQYLKLGQVDKAIEPLTKAVELMPKEFNAHLNLGIALMNKKEFTAAEKQLREAIAINNAAPTAHMYLGIVLFNTYRDKDQKFIPERWAEAQTELETATKMGKDEVAQAHKYLAGIYAGNKDYKRGADELELYLKLAPKAPDADKLKAAIKEWRGKS